MANWALFALACGVSGARAADAPSTARIALVAGGPSTYFTYWDKAGADAKAQYGIKDVTYAVPPTPEYDPTVQINTINSLISSGYNAFGIFPDGSTALQTTYTRMHARGIPVIDIAGCSTEPTAALFCLATDVDAASYYETKVLIKAIGGHGNVALLTGLLTDNNTILRDAGVKRAIDETNGEVKLTQILSNIDTPSEAPAAVQGLLANHGSELQGMLSPTYYPSVAAAAIMMKNPQYRNIKFIGTDNDPTVMAAIQNGAIYGTMYQNSAGQATIASYVLNKVVSDKCTVRTDAPFKTTPQTKRFIDSGYLFVGGDNVKDFVNGPESIPSATKEIMTNIDKYISCPKT